MARKPSYTRRPLHTLSKEHLDRLRKSDEARASNPLRRGGKSEPAAPTTTTDDEEKGDD
jgi:hypothetical protein